MSSHHHRRRLGLGQPDASLPSYHCDAVSIRIQARKKEHKPKLLSPDIFRWGRGLPHEGVGAKKFGMSLETREIKLFWQDILGFCWDIPVVPEKFEKKKVSAQFLALKNANKYSLLHSS